MQTASLQSLHVSDNLKKDLTGLCARLESAAKDQLLSVIVYGGLAREEFIPELSNINLLILIKDAKVHTLSLLAPVLEQASLTLNISPFVLSEEELYSSANFFSIKFLDIKQDHIVLYGKDLIKETEVNEENLRRNCQRELKNILLRMNQLYIRHYRFPEILEERLVHLFTSFLVNLNIVLYLKTGTYYHSKEAIAQAGAKFLHLDSAFLDQLLSLKKGAHLPGPELIRLFDDFMGLTKQISDQADSLQK